MKKFLKIFCILTMFVCSGLIMGGCDDELVLVTGVDLYTNEIYADVNDSFDLSYKVYPSNATNKKVTFSSTDENIASVDEAGKVTLKSAGEATIVVRSVDGGFEDVCKIITNIDPEAIAWETGDKLTAHLGVGYSATGSMALNQVMKLKLDYILDGVESDKVTNKKVVFTSSNPSNIQVINESEGIIKAINNEIISGDKAFSDITATLTTTTGTLSATCRIYINEYSSLDHLFVKYTEGDTPVLNYRNGSETIFLTSGGESVDFYAYITNMSDVVKTDYEMMVETGSESPFKIENFTSKNGIYKFRLTPSEDKVGPGTLYIRTTCSDESGKSIRCSINVMVQAEIKSVQATATNRTADDGYEILQNGEIFSVGLKYFNADGDEIVGVTRDINFVDLSTITISGLSSPSNPGEPAKLSEFIADYGNNQFKVTRVPDNPKQLFVLKGLIYVENVETSASIAFEYKFYLRNPLESLIVSDVPKTGAVPSVGVSTLTLPAGGETPLYAYATTYNFALTEPAEVSLVVDNSGLVSFEKRSTNEFMIIASGTTQGEAVITFIATDGVSTITYDVHVYVVAQVAKIGFYSNFDTNGQLTSPIDSSVFYEVSGTTARIYFMVEPASGEYVLECQAGVSVKAKNGTIHESVLATPLKVLRYIDVDISALSVGQTKTIEITCERFLVSQSLTLKKV